MGLLNSDDLIRMGKSLSEERERRATAEALVEGLRGQVTGLERQTGHLLEALARERDLLQRATERNELLVTQIVEMKREGFVPAPFGQSGNMEHLKLDLPDRVMDAISQRSMGDSALERQLTKYALTSFRAKSTTEDDVVQSILVGGTPPDEDDE